MNILMNSVKVHLNDLIKSSNMRILNFTIVLLSITAIWLALAGIKRSQCSNEKTIPNALNIMRNGVSRIRSTLYDNINPVFFSNDKIDIDEDGKSIMENLEFRIYENFPFRDLKTVLISVSWPNPELLRSNESSQGAGRTYLNCILFVDRSLFS
jgi:hypothetical protein